MENSSGEVQWMCGTERESEGEGAFYYVIRPSDTSSLTHTNTHTHSCTLQHKAEKAV